MNRTAALVALLLLSACGAEVETASPSAAPSEAPAAPAPELPDRAPVAYADELAGVDAAITNALDKANKNATDWMNLDFAASGMLRRARLTGDWGDYARAQQTLDRAFDVAPDGSGPQLTRASMDHSLHRLDRVGPALDRLEALNPIIRPKERVMLQKRGALALQLGDYAAARDQLQRSVDLKPTLGSLGSLARTFWLTGDFDTAESLYRGAFERYHAPAAEPIAWLHLQLGLMDLDRGRWDEALAHYEDADRTLSGWYLVQEHIAEIYTLRGETDRAAALYEAIVEDTGNPEFMDALAGIAQERGDAEAASRWIALARAEHEDRIAAFPEAAWGHALDHFLEFEDDPSRALEMAEANHAVRPNGLAKTALAQALLAADRAADARVRVEEALATPFRTADLHAVAFEVYTALGEADLASQQRAAALAINPRVLD